MKTTSDAQESAGAKSKKVQSAEVGTEILKALAALAPSTSLKNLSDYLGMPAAKVHRYLQALIASGFATQDVASNHYALGYEALHVGLAAIRSLDVAKLAAPVLAELRDRLRHTCFLAIWGNHGPTVVQVEPAQGMVTLVTQIGSVLPLQGSSTGLVFSAFLPAAAEEGASVLRNQIRREGLHAVHGLLMPGVNAVSAPVFGIERKLVGVITVVGPGASLNVDLQGEAACCLREAARGLSTRMGGEG